MKQRIDVYPKPIPSCGPHEEAYDICVGNDTVAVLYFSQLTRSDGQLTIYGRKVSGYYDFELREAGLRGRDHYHWLTKQ